MWVRSAGTSGQLGSIGRRWRRAIRKAVGQDDLAQGDAWQVLNAAEKARAGHLGRAEQRLVGMLELDGAGAMPGSPTVLLRAGHDARDAGLVGLSRQAWIAARSEAPTRSGQNLTKAIDSALELLEMEDAPVSASDDAAGAVVRHLTAWEASVAPLATSRRTNAERATRLALSVRTIEGHMYRIFEKLGIRRWEELVPLLFPNRDEAARPTPRSAQPPA